MVDPVKTRITHVKRVTGEDEDGENGQIWFDIERIDDLKSKQEQGPSFLRAIRREFWADEDDDAAHPTRELTEEEYHNPKDNNQFVPVNAITQMLTKSGQGPSYLKNKKRYRNKEDDNNTNQTRIFQVRRVYHAEATISADGTYTKQVPTAEDRKQYIDVALLKKIIQKTGQGPTYRLRTFLLNYEPLTEYSELLEDDVTTVGDGVVYLDPFQNVVNVQWPDDDEGPDEDEEPEEPPFEYWDLIRMIPTSPVVPGGLIQAAENWIVEDVTSGAALAAAYPLREPDPFHQIILPHEFYGTYPDAFSAMAAQDIYNQYWVANQKEWPSYPPPETTVPGGGFVIVHYGG